MEKKISNQQQNIKTSQARQHPIIIFFIFTLLIILTYFIFIVKTIFFTITVTIVAICSFLWMVKKPGRTKKFKGFATIFILIVEVLVITIDMLLFLLQMDRPQIPQQPQNAQVQTIQKIQPRVDVAMDNSRAKSFTIRISTFNNDSILKKRMISHSELVQKIRAALAENYFSLLNLSPEKNYILRLNFFFHTKQKKLIETGKVYYRVISHVKGSVSSGDNSVITISGSCNELHFDVKKALDSVVTQICMKTGRAIVEKLKNTLLNKSSE